MAQRIKNFRFSKRFKKDYQKCPSHIQKSFDAKPPLFLKNPEHPSFRIKKMQAMHEIWEGSITMQFRFTFQYKEEVLIFRRIGTHGILKKEVR